jgi:hypothetical protein
MWLKGELRERGSIDKNFKSLYYTKIGIDTKTSNFAESRRIERTSG